ncbi:MAG: hypothetical protein ABIQ88_20605 [Chitinophagaceae bacterium]
MKSKHIIATVSAFVIAAGIVYYRLSQTKKKDETSTPEQLAKEGTNKIREVMHHAKQSYTG